MRLILHIFRCQKKIYSQKKLLGFFIQVGKSKTIEMHIFLHFLDISSRAETTQVVSLVHIVIFFSQGWLLRKILQSFPPKSFTESLKKSPKIIAKSFTGYKSKTCMAWFSKNLQKINKTCHGFHQKFLMREFHQGLFCKISNKLLQIFLMNLPVI